MRNSSHFQRQWWPLYNRFGFSSPSPSTQTCNASGTGPYIIASLSTTNANNNIFLKRSFSASAHSCRKSFGFDHGLEHENDVHQLFLPIDHDEQHPPSNFINLQVSNENHLCGIDQPEQPPPNSSVNSSCPASVVSALANVCVCSNYCLGTKPILLLRRSSWSSAPSFQFVHSPRRTYCDDSATHSPPQWRVAPVASSRERRRQRGSKRLWRIRKLRCPRLERHIPLNRLSDRLNEGVEDVLEDCRATPPLISKGLSSIVKRANRGNHHISNVVKRYSQYPAVKGKTQDNNNSNSSKVATLSSCKHEAEKRKTDEKSADSAVNTPSSPSEFVLVSGEFVVLMKQVLKRNLTNKYLNKHLSRTT